jgi:hypothetical protein
MKTPETELMDELKAVMAEVMLTGQLSLTDIEAVSTFMQGMLKN